MSANVYSRAEALRLTRSSRLRDQERLDSKARQTPYQRAHGPRARWEVQCEYAGGLVDGRCPECLRMLSRPGRPHKPDPTGALGWLHWYADGSVRLIPPDPDAASSLRSQKERRAWFEARQ